MVQARRIVRPYDGYKELGYWTVSLCIKSVYISEFKAYAHHDVLEAWIIKNVKLGDYGLSGDGINNLCFDFENIEDAVAFKLHF